jgi:hypothetical protein
MFTRSNIVRVVTDDGDGNIMMVAKDSNEDTGITEVYDPNGKIIGWDTKDLEFVTQDLKVHDSIPMKPQHTNMNIDILHEEFNKYLISLIKRAIDAGHDGSISLKVFARSFSGCNETDVQYTAICDHDEEVTSGNLTFSLDTAVRRHLENKEMQMPAIPHYK